MYIDIYRIENYSTLLKTCKDFWEVSGAIHRATEASKRAS